MLRTVVALWLTAASALASANYLTDGDLAKIKQYMPMYQWAADLARVPVLALPALHYRESDLRATWQELPDDQRTTLVRRKIPYRNLGGPFMMDWGADGDGVLFDENIRDYERQVAALFGITPAPRVRDDFRFACLCAATELRSKARGKLFYKPGRVDEDVLADAMWGYNGRWKRQRVWKKSSYVVNDPKRGTCMMIRPYGNLSATEWLDERPGTMVLYREIERRIK